MLENNEEFTPKSIYANKNDLEEKEIDCDLNEILEKENRSLLYEAVMCFNHVRAHHIALAIYILSIIGLSLLICQVIIIFNPITIEFGLSKTEEVILYSSIFLSITLGFLIKYFVIKKELFKRIILTSSAINSSLVLLMMIFKSSLIFYLTYPTISLIYSVMHFTCLEMFDDFYFATDSNPSKRKILYRKNIIHSFFSLSTILLTINYYAFFSNLGFNRWNLTFMMFLVINLAIFVLSFYIEESALNLKRNNYNSEAINDLLRNQMKREFDTDELKCINYDLFVLLERYESARLKIIFSSIYKRTTIFFLINICILSFIIFGLIFLVPALIYENLNNNRMTFVNKVFMFLLISMSGQIIGAPLVFFTVIQRRFILSYFFFLIVIFSIISLSNEKLVFTCGGIMLFSAFLNFQVIYQFTFEIYTENLADKVYKLLTVAFFASAIFVFPLSIIFYRISKIAGLISIMSAAAIGVISSLMINRDIKVIKKFNY